MIDTTAILPSRRRIRAHGRNRRAELPGVVEEYPSCEEADPAWCVSPVIRRPSFTRSRNCAARNEPRAHGEYSGRTGWRRADREACVIESSVEEQIDRALKGR